MHKSHSRDAALQWRVLSQTTPEASAGNIQKAVDFLHAFMLGFAVQDAVALLRLEDLFVGEYSRVEAQMLRVCCACVCVRACACECGSIGASRGGGSSRAFISQTRSR